MSTRPGTHRIKSKIQTRILENIVLFQRLFPLGRGKWTTRKGRMPRSPQVFDFNGAPYGSRTRLFRLKIQTFPNAFKLLAN